MDDDRILNRRGRKHFRRTYSTAEARIGAAIGVSLLAITAWIVWRGRRADPELAMTAADLMEPAKTPSAGAAGDRGKIPASIAPPGWIEKNIASFDESNLYEKINGREGYYKNFGFARLDFVSLVDSTRAESYVDVELFDLSRAENALGAMAGEIPEHGTPSFTGGALVHEGRNAVLLAKGRYYARLIGADESAPIKAALAHAKGALLETFPAEPLPFGFTLFTGLLGVPPDRVGYEAENAFSFSFAKDVHIGRLPDESELFVVLTENSAAAQKLAAQLTGGFKEYGEDAGAAAGVSWVRDRYLSTIAGAAVEGRIVAGVRGVPDRERAVAELAKLRAAVRAAGGETK